jgi:hypothetical protein
LSSEEVAVEETAVPEGFVDERRGDVRLILRKDVAPLLLDAGIERPEELVRGPFVVGTLGGRGPVAVLELPRPDADPLRIVVRTYRHGGALGGFTGELFLGESRALRELAALRAARAAGVDVVDPVAAISRRVRGGFHRAHLVTEEVRGARDLVAWLREGRLPSPRLVFQAVGRALRRLHDAGIGVPDLHLKNVLVRGETPGHPVLVDFDGAVVGTEPAPRPRRLRELFRLDRSVEKLARRGVRIGRLVRARVFRGYLAGERVHGSERADVCRRYRRHLGLHRLAWRLRGGSA